jgi:hypothetical protein
MPGRLAGMTVRHPCVDLAGGRIIKNTIEQLGTID